MEAEKKPEMNELPCADQQKDDFFTLVEKMQSGRMNDQRCPLPVNNKVVEKKREDPNLPKVTANEDRIAICLNDKEELQLFREPLNATHCGCHHNFYECGQLIDDNQSEEVRICKTLRDRMAVLHEVRQNQPKEEAMKVECSTCLEKISPCKLLLCATCDPILKSAVFGELGPGAYHQTSEVCSNCFVLNHNGHRPWKFTTYKNISAVFEVHRNYKELIAQLREDAVDEFKRKITRLEKLTELVETSCTKALEVAEDSDLCLGIMKELGVEVASKLSSCDPEDDTVIANPIYDGDVEDSLIDSNQREQFGDNVSEHDHIYDNVCEDDTMSDLNDDVDDGFELSEEEVDNEDAAKVPKGNEVVDLSDDEEDDSSIGSYEYEQIGDSDSEDDDVYVNVHDILSNRNDVVDEQIELSEQEVDNEDATEDPNEDEVVDVIGDEEVDDDEEIDEDDDRKSTNNGVENQFRSLYLDESYDSESDGCFDDYISSDETDIDNADRANKKCEDEDEDQNRDEHIDEADDKGKEDQNHSKTENDAEQPSKLDSIRVVDAAWNQFLHDLNSIYYRGH